MSNQTLNLNKVEKKVHETTALIVDLEDERPSTVDEMNKDFRRCMGFLGSIHGGENLSETYNEAQELFEEYKEKHPNPEEVLEEAREDIEETVKSGGKNKIEV